MCYVDVELSSIFIHPTLQCLTISCASFDGAELKRLKAFSQRTPLSTLSLDQCDMSASGLTAILSLPVSLKSLKILEVSRQGPRRHALDYSQPLLEALTLQRKSVEFLCLSLREPRLSPFRQEFDMSSFHALRLLRISCQGHNDSVYPTSPKWTTYAPPALDTLVFGGIEIQNRADNTTLPSELQACLKALRPADLCSLARTVCLSLQSGSDVRADARKAVEALGKHFRKALSQKSHAASSATTCRNSECKDGPRLYVTRFTRHRGAIPPYLYREYEPEELPLYDSSSKSTGWLNPNDGNDLAPFLSHPSEHLSYDFSALEDDVLHDFDFDSFLNTADDADMYPVFGDPFLHGDPAGNALPAWPVPTGPDHLNVFSTHAVNSHLYTHGEEDTDSVD